MNHVVIVLGCSRTVCEISPAVEDFYTPYHHSYSRVKKALDVYNQIETENKIFICSGYKGQAQKMKKFLTEMGIKNDKILCEPYSRNTIENCIFSYDLLNRWMLTLENFGSFNISGIEDEYLTKLGYPSIDVKLASLTGDEISFKSTCINIHVVTNDYHIDRSATVFQHFSDRLTSAYQFFFHSANIIDFIDNEDVRIDIQKCFDIEKTIDIPKLLSEYHNWHPSSKDYTIRK